MKNNPKRQSKACRKALLRALLANPQLVRVAPTINVFMSRYMNKFPLVQVDGQLILHSHLPPLSSQGFTRFIDEHLIGRVEGPSHAQLGLTNLCPQSCHYCYNKGRQGTLLTTPEIIATIGQLKALGVCWLGLTGGEPLEHPDLLQIVRSVGSDCALKLFTTGTQVTDAQAAQLRQAGLLYVSVSLDHWEAEHDRVRGLAGAYQAALKGIEIFLAAGMHVSVSTVVSREMLAREQVPEFLEFLTGLGVHEAWLSEAKPAVPELWRPEAVITEAERLALVDLQDRYNRQGNITVNYLGHFEGKEHFGCNAGHKMIYVDAFGQIGPCVFAPLTLGNLREEPLAGIWSRMRRLFPSEGECFVNKNYSLLAKYYRDRLPLDREESLALLQEVSFGPPSEFARRYYGK